MQGEWPTTLSYAQLLRHNFIINSGVMLHRSLLEATADGKPEIRFNVLNRNRDEDYEMWRDIMKRWPELKIGFVRRPLLWYDGAHGHDVPAP
jgi:hypothetical protein